MADFRLWVRTLSPLYIGTGTKLRNGYDFIFRTNTQGEPITMRLNEEKILEQEYDPNLPLRLPGEMVRGKEDQAEYFRYTLDGSPRCIETDGRLWECVKDIDDIPYISGSTLKGAVRTAYGAHLLKMNGVIPKEEINIRRKAKDADNSLQKKLFGKTAKTDFLRALQVSDVFSSSSERNPQKLIRVYHLNPVSRCRTAASTPIDVEGIQPETDFQGSLRIDEYVRASLSPEKENLLTKGGFISILREHSTRKLEILQQWYNEALESEDALTFLNQLINCQSHLEPNQALLQIGSGTGWDDMTYSDWLKSDMEFFTDLYLHYFRKKNRESPGSPAESAATFPGSRKVTTRQDKIFQPMGWVLLTLFEKES